jgi:hypothetical protein
MANPKVEFRVPPPSYAALDYLRRFGHYGDSVGEIARTLMNRELDDLRRGGVIPPDLAEIPTDSPPAARLRG